MDAPAVSIGLPVHNGGEHLQTAVDSLLAQDFRDFELIISDNASDDGTSAIGDRYSRADARVRFHRNPANIGAAANFNRAFALSRGKYFMWAAHDDRWHPQYVSRCLAGLEQNPDAVLCGSTVRFIDQRGDELTDETILGAGYNPLHTRSMSLIERCRELTKTLDWYATYGLIRSDALRKTKLFRNTFGGDVLLLMELLYHGETVILPDALHHYRLVRKTPGKHLESITGALSQGERLKPYTQLAQGLLEVIDEFEVSVDSRAILREELLENVSFANWAWAANIAAENERNFVSGSRHLASIQIRDLLSGVSGRSPRQVRDLAERRLLARLHLGERLRHTARRLLDRHILWRLG